MNKTAATKNLSPAPARQDRPAAEKDAAPATEALGAAEVLTHRVCGLAENGFWRAGRHWPREGVEVNRADFTDAQWSALEGERNVAVIAL